MSWIAAPIWFVASFALVMASFGFGRAIMLSAENGDSEKIAAYFLTACAFAVASSLLAALAVIIGRV